MSRFTGSFGNEQQSRHFTKAARVIFIGTFSRAVANGLLLFRS